MKSVCSNERVSITYGTPRSIGPQLHQIKFANAAQGLCANFSHRWIPMPQGYGKKVVDEATTIFVVPTGIQQMHARN